MANLYFDESGTHQGSRLMTVAGYWLEEPQSDRFSRDWAKQLAKFGLTHAHMTDCALGFGEYRNLTLQQRIDTGKRLIENIKRRSRFGFTVTINPNEYAEVVGSIPHAPTCYTHCLMTLFHGVTKFADANKYDGKINYFFEAGHESQKEADLYLSAIPLHGEDWVRATRYGKHGFLDKKEALPLQAADMLAWQTRHYFERRIDGHFKPRKDLVALVRPFDLNVEFHSNAILAVRDSILELEPLVTEGHDLAAFEKAAEIYRRHGLRVTPSPVFMNKNKN